jgi:hypothetical protein
MRFRLEAAALPERPRVVESSAATELNRARREWRRKRLRAWRTGR